MPYTIGREQRDALHTQTTRDLAEIEEIALALQNSAYELAHELGSRYGALIALMDEIGWDPDDPRDTFELTLSDPRLAQALRRQERLAVSLVVVRMEQVLDDDPDSLTDVRESGMVAALCSDMLQQLASTDTPIGD